MNVCMSSNVLAKLVLLSMLDLGLFQIAVHFDTQALVSPNHLTQVTGCSFLDSTYLLVLSDDSCNEWSFIMVCNYGPMGQDCLQSQSLNNCLRIMFINSSLFNIFAWNPSNAFSNLEGVMWRAAIPQCLYSVLK